MVLNIFLLYLSGFLLKFGINSFVSGWKIFLSALSNLGKPILKVVIARIIIPGSGKLLIVVRVQCLKFSGKVHIFCSFYTQFSCLLCSLHSILEGLPALKIFLTDTL